MNAKQNSICAIAGFALLFAVGKAFLWAMGLGWRANNHFFREIIVILSVAVVAYVLARDRQ